MRVRTAGLLIISILLLCGQSFPRTKSKAPKLSWQDGQVVSAALNGHGRNSKPVRGAVGSGNQDIWWTYCISTTDKAYSVVSRMGPAKTELLDEKPVRIADKRGQLLIVNSAGRQMEMRVLRKSSSSKCPE